MKKLFVILFAALFMFAGCGGSDGGSSDSSAAHAPRITGYEFGPIAAAQGAGGGSIPMFATIYFEDAGGDVIAVHIISDAAGDVAIPLTGEDGITKGWITLTNLYKDTRVKGIFWYEIYLVDSTGARSASRHVSVEIH